MKSRLLRFLKLIGLTALLIVLLIVAGIGAIFLRSDLYSFRPRLGRIHKIIETQRQATPTIPPFLLKCIENDLTNNGVDLFSAKQLLFHFDLNRTTNFRWPVRCYMWCYSVRWHISPSDRDLLACAFLGSDGNGHQGIHHMSQRLHKKPITELSEYEIAEVVVACRGPTRYLRDREILKRHSEDLVRMTRSSEAEQFTSLP
jgi:hypothetical protein